MIKVHLYKNLGFIIALTFLSGATFAQINREAVVKRHIIHIDKIDSLSSLSVGNGRFAFTVDATGLQTFPERYEKGVSLGTQSEWGWDSFKNTEGYKIQEAYKYYDQYGRKIPYVVQLNEPLRAKEATNYFRQNVHRLQLGNIGLELIKSNGALALDTDIKNINQTLDPWTGEVKSLFTFEGIAVEVRTFAGQDQDIVSAQVKSELIKLGRLKIRIRFPYPTGEWADVGNNQNDVEKHHSSIVSSQQNVGAIQHHLDSATYYTSFSWSGLAKLKEKTKHYFTLSPAKNLNTFSFSCLFAPNKSIKRVSSFEFIKANNILKWKAFWLSGAAVDFKGSTDNRANELERRIVLSQYLTKIQCAGDFPPQETGLTYNSWFGKPHLEMHWWHATHFALWGRPSLLTPSMNYYFKVKSKAAQIATLQGFKGVRWQK